MSIQWRRLSYPNRVVSLPLARGEDLTQNVTSMPKPIYPNRAMSLSLASVETPPQYTSLTEHHVALI